MKHESLFRPLSLGPLQLPNRIIMAPLTRCRAEDDHVPGTLMAEHYAQRASAGLIIAEATMVAEGNSAFWKEPGIYSAAQVAGWKLTTDAVHAQRGRIFLQLWHGGRACHPLLNAGQETVAPSPLRIENNDVHTPEGKQPFPIPRELRDDEIPGIIAAFKTAAANAKLAGFDGVEVHGANGYLLDTFLRDGSNHRVGDYGGPLENRARLLLEVVDAVSEVWGADRVGVRISPLNSFNSMIDSDPISLTKYVAAHLDHRGVAYLHLMRADLLGEQQGDLISAAQEVFDGTLITNMGYTVEEAAAGVADGTLAAVAFGRPFISNPDLVERIQSGATLAESDPATYYSQGPHGYTDYPRA